MHKRTILSMVALVALMLIATAALPLLAVSGQDQTSGQSAVPANDRFGMTSMNGTGQQLDQAGLINLFQALSDRDPLFGPLSNDNGNISGRYISFVVNPANGTLQNYALNVSGNRTPIFTSVVASGFKPTTWNVSGPLFTEKSDNLTVFAHNNPMGSFHVAAADSASINLSMPAGFTVVPLTASNATAKAWEVTGNGITGILVLKNGTLTTNLGSSTSAAGYINVSLSPDSSLAFRALPIAGGFPLADERFLISQLANWSIEGELAVITVANTTFWVANEEGSLVPNVNASQGAVFVNLTPMRRATGGNASLLNLLPGGQSNGSNPAPPVAQTVSDTNAQRTWYVIAMDKNTLNPANGTAQVFVNGFRLTMANSPTELAANNTTFWAYQGTNASVFVVPLPAVNASASIVVQEGTQANPSTAAAVNPAAITVAGAAIIGVVAVIGSVAYMRRK